VFKDELLSDGKTISGEMKATMGSAPFMLYRTGGHHAGAGEVDGVVNRVN